MRLGEISLATSLSSSGHSSCKRTRTARRSFFAPTPQRAPPVRIGASPPRSLALARIVAAFEKLVASSALAAEVRTHVHCIETFNSPIPLLMFGRHVLGGICASFNVESCRFRPPARCALSLISFRRLLQFS